MTFTDVMSIIGVIVAIAVAIGGMVTYLQKKPPRKLITRVSMAIGFVLVCVIILALGISYLSTHSTITVQGAVSCTSHSLVGVWVQSSGGGSGFAKWSRSSSNDYDGTFSTTIWTALPTTLQLHVGCGGSTSSWWSDNWTPEKSVSGSVTLEASCNEGTQQPAKGSNSRCAFSQSTPSPSAYPTVTILSPSFLPLTIPCKEQCPDSSFRIVLEKIVFYQPNNHSMEWSFALEDPNYDTCAMQFRRIQLSTQGLYEEGNMGQRFDMYHGRGEFTVNFSLPKFDQTYILHLEIGCVPTFVIFVDQSFVFGKE